MGDQKRRILIATGGTGGHVFPGLVLAHAWRARGDEVTWLGTARGIESRVVPQADIPMDIMQISALRGQGKWALLAAPFRLMRALWQALKILRQRKPDLVVGLGGFVSGPAGMAAFLTRTPLVLQEQNAVAGMTNQQLQRVAQHVFAGFPNAFKSDKRVLVTGNPVRKAITDLPAPATRFQDRSGALRILVLGGSLGALRLNETVPQACQQLHSKMPVTVWHQCGERSIAQAKAAYAQVSFEYTLAPFIEEMGQAYAWADLVICRAGASTVSELIAAGLGAILVPYPYAVDDHQTRNAQFLVSQKAGVIIPDAQFSVPALMTQLQQWGASRAPYLAMAQAAQSLSRGDAAQLIVAKCEDLLGAE